MEDRRPEAPAATAAASMRDDANRVALERWAAEIGGASTPAFQEPDVLLQVSRAWEAAVQAAGPLEIV